jgi:PAS domain S-box-containing protein
VLAMQAAISLENTRLYSEVQEREARIRRLLDANIVGITIWELDTPRLIEVNDAFLDIVGYSREELVSGRMPWPELTPPEWRAVDAQRFADLRATGRSTAVEKEFVRKDGRRVPVLVGAAAFEGQPNAGVSFVLDLTERKRAEEALRQMQVEIAHVSRVATLGELASSIAHEVNQPLAAIVAEADACRNWLARANPPLHLVGEALDAIAKDGYRAGEVIQRIRQLATKTEPQRVALDLNEVIRDVVPLVRLQLERRDVLLSLDLASGLAPVLGDRIQLQQVILNLAMNAIEAMASVADRRRKLVIRAGQPERDHVTIDVMDTGVGIAANHLDHVFDAFFTTKPGGMGMGLSISRSIVEAHGGRLWATSNPAHGITFHFSLPTMAMNPPSSTASRSELGTRTE